MHIGPPPSSLNQINSRQEASNPSDNISMVAGNCTSNLSAAAADIITIGKLKIPWQLTIYRGVCNYYQYPALTSSIIESTRTEMINPGPVVKPTVQINISDVHMPIDDLR